MRVWTNPGLINAKIVLSAKARECAPLSDFAVEIANVLIKTCNV